MQQTENVKASWKIVYHKQNYLHIDLPEILDFQDYIKMNLLDVAHMTIFGAYSCWQSKDVLMESNGFYKLPILWIMWTTSKGPSKLASDV